MLGRLIIDDVRPRTPGGRPAKASVGELVPLSCDVLRDGHDHVRARACVRSRAGGGSWEVVAMEEVGNDRWEGWFAPHDLGAHQLRVEAWTDRPETWARNVEAKVAAGQPIDVEVEEGARLFERLAAAAPRAVRAELAAAAAELRASGDPASVPVELLLAASLVPDPLDLTRSLAQDLWVDRRIGSVGAWYELFPRSEGGLAGTVKRLSDIAAMGFDVVYLPPIHPIGRTHRKGRDNTLAAGTDDPGSPWAIGSAEGGHTAIAPELGDFGDFEALLDAADDLGLEIALDYALQCSPDHPWVRDHPEWFRHRPDGSIKHAENPPKKYQDIFPLEFWPEEESDRVEMWDACKAILEFWIDRGVRIFRVDNPHTKPFAFWDWAITDIRERHPDVVFLAEAFTRPKVMAQLAEVGFNQSYTYFTWRTERWEIEEYLEELSQAPLADYMRPAFWPNTPDILSGPLRDGPPAAFEIRLLLAALMAPTYGIYSGYELCENEPASPDNEEYKGSEKYEVKQRDWSVPWSLAGYVTKVNEIRRRHPAFSQLRTIRFHGTSGNEHVVAWSKTAPDGSDAMLCIVSLDAHDVQETVLALDLEALGLEEGATFDVHDELDGSTYTWTGANPYVRFEPGQRVGHVLRVEARAAEPS